MRAPLGTPPRYPRTWSKPKRRPGRRRIPPGSDGTQVRLSLSSNASSMSSCSRRSEPTGSCAHKVRWTSLRCPGQTPHNEDRACACAHAVQSMRSARRRVGLVAHRHHRSSPDPLPQHVPGRGIRLHVHSDVPLRPNRLCPVLQGGGSAAAASGKVRVGGGRGPLLRVGRILTLVCGAHPDVGFMTWDGARSATAVGFGHNATPASALPAEVADQLQYYSPAIHAAAFVLPRFAQRRLGLPLSDQPPA